MNTQPGQSFYWVSKARHSKTLNNKKIFMEHRPIIDPVREAAQKDYRQMKELFRDDIKKAVEKQKIHNRIRKDPNDGDRSVAESRYRVNGFDLRCMYIAYALFRQMYGGYTKEPEQGMIVQGIAPGVVTSIVLPLHRRPVSPKYITEIIQKYVPKTVYTG